MSYIGRGLDKISNIEKLDAITFDGSQSYSLTKSSVAFTPNSANSLIISINGVCQFGNVTVSGTSVDFGVAMPSTDTNDFILHLGVGVVNTPADATVTNAKLGTDVISGETDIGGAIADADLFLLDDGAGGTLRKTAASRIKTYVGGGIFESALLHIRDEKSSGTSGSSSSSGSWQTRTLNTVKTNEITSASLSSNQISLPSGTYYIMAKASHFDGDRHKIKLANITDSSDEIIGSSEYAEDVYNGTTNSYLNGRFTISDTKVFEIQHRCEVTGSFGVASSFTVVEVYADVQIWKVA